MSEGTYVVDVKPSARRASAAVGQYVRDEGGRKEFDSREAAEEWAAEVSEEHGLVWVRDANPNDAAPVDGYLMALPRVTAPVVVEQLRANGAGTDGDDDSEQGGLERYGVEVVADPHESDQLPLERFDLS